jgi:hypothetical protein
MKHLLPAAIVGATLIGANVVLPFHAAESEISPATE